MPAATIPRSGVRLCLDARPYGNWWQCTEVARGTKDWTQLRLPSIPVKDKGAYKFWLGVYGAGRHRLVRQRQPDRARKPPLDVFLLYPNFRGMLFDDRSQTVRVAWPLGARAACVWRWSTRRADSPREPRIPGAARAHRRAGRRRPAAGTVSAAAELLDAGGAARARPGLPDRQDAGARA
jgi:hypothetical protein